MAETSPRVSLGLPVYNGENFLRDAFESLLAQSYRDFEVVVCDNASTDGTEAICREYAARDPRIRYRRNDENIGAAPNFNLAFDLADAGAEYFKWVAHDDVLDPDFLAATVAVLDADADCVLCHTEVVFIDGSGDVIRDYDAGLARLASPRRAQRFGDLASMRHWCFDVFGLIRRDVLAATPRIASYVGSDRNLLAELALHGTVRRVPRALFRSREHDARSIRTAELEDRAAWFAPRLAGKKTMPHWRHLREYLRSVHRVRIGTSERLRCYGELLRWCVRSRRLLWRDVKQRLRGAFARGDDTTSSRQRRPA